MFRKRGGSLGEMLLVTTAFLNRAEDWVQVGVGAPCRPIYTAPDQVRLRSSLLNSVLSALR